MVSQIKCKKYYQIAEITIQLESSLPITETTFMPKYKLFQVNDPGEDIIQIRHHFSIPKMTPELLSQRIYHKAPWEISRTETSWIYTGFFSSTAKPKKIYKLGIFNHDHTIADIYHENEVDFRRGNLGSLSLLPSDQIILARVLGDRAGCYLHSCGVVFHGCGLLFAGHSDAGKTTMARIMQDQAKILCDDRIIVRKIANDYRIYGTWSHGDIPVVSPNSAPLKAILFLEKSTENAIIPIHSPKAIIEKLIACVIKPLETKDWWHKTLSFLEGVGREIPCYTLKFDRNPEIIAKLRKL